MKPLKLLTLTSRYYLVIFTVLMAFFFTAQYLVITREATGSIDEVLYNRKEHIVDEFKKSQGIISSEVFRYSNFSLDSLPARPDFLDHYADTVIYESVDDEWDEFRRIRSSFEFGGRYYGIEIVTPRLETHEIVTTILQSLSIIFLLTVIGFYFATRYFSRRLWTPFYNVIDQLNSFDVGSGSIFKATPNRITEFVSLNQSIEELTTRTKRSFYDQKQFIENASHEMQTPLAILQSKLELLIGDPHLTEEQSGIIQTLINSTQRLGRLNKTLLLLSKIENQQFTDVEKIPLQQLIAEVLTYFEEQKENLSIQIDLQVGQEAVIQSHRMLTELLITNLIKNAFFHNTKDGKILIRATSDRFVVENSSGSPPIPQASLFQRFYKNSANVESWGLGLAIVKKVCDINRWKISYLYTEGWHRFEVVFKSGNS